MNCIEICAGAGGQALGLERAGFEAQALVEIDAHACATLRLNRPLWRVIEADVKSFSAALYKGIELVAGGVPCPPFSVAGKQLGADDERDLFPEALRLVDEARPQAVMLENVRGFLDAGFTDYRNDLQRSLEKLGYFSDIRLIQASNYGVSQLRPRVIIVAMKRQFVEYFEWPTPNISIPKTVGDLLIDLMSVNHWSLAQQWRGKADTIAPTIVGGSKKHGGPDLGPTRAKKAWMQLGVDGHGIADEAPAEDFFGLPRLTTRMVARIQGFPDSWQFAGKKTAAYRQIGNAFPPPVAKTVAYQLAHCIRMGNRVFASAEVPA
jgi:DNA (cytosine-5)-methyltransferase 1